jgi:hypothetical protein
MRLLNNHKCGHSTLAVIVSLLLIVCYNLLVNTFCLTIPTLQTQSYCNFTSPFFIGSLPLGKQFGPAMHRKTAMSKGHKERVYERRQ